MKSRTIEEATVLLGNISNDFETFHTEASVFLLNGNKSANRRTRKRSVKLRAEMKELRELLLIIEKETK